jgi:hypothetical protein
MSQEEMQERAHHPRSPSGLQMEEACPMYARRNTTSAAAEKGTKQHAITETGQDDNELSDDEVYAAVQCMEFADQQKQRLLKYGPVEDIKEAYLPIDDREWVAHIYNPDTYKVEKVPCKGTTAGYVDRVLIGCRGRVAIVADWKFGKWPIEDAENNLQGIAYVLGLFHKYPRLRTVDLYFKQPHLDHLTHHRFQKRDTDSLTLRVMTVVERADRATELGDYDRATPCIPACLFCARMADCHKMHEIVLDVGNKFHPIEFPDDIDPSILRDPKNFAKGMRLQQVVKTWADAYRRRGVDFVLTGQALIPEGFTLVKDVKLNVHDKEVFKKLARSFLTEREYTEALKPGLTATQKAISDKMPRGEKGKAVEQFRKSLEGTDAVKETDPIVYLKAAPKKKDKK